MGVLKEYTRTAVQRNNKVGIRNHGAASICADQAERCRKLKGKLLSWRTRHNHELKTPQLVHIIGIYDNHVLLEKTAYSIDGTENRIRYSVSYCSLYCGLDTFSLMEGFHDAEA